MKIPKFLKRFLPQPKVETLEEFLGRLGPPPACLKGASPSEFKATEYGAAMLAKFQEMNPDGPPPTKEEIDKVHALWLQHGIITNADHEKRKVLREKESLEVRNSALEKDRKWLLGELETARLRMADLQKPTS